MVKVEGVIKKSSLSDCLTRSLVALVLAAAICSLGATGANADSITYTTGYGSAPYGPLVATTWNTNLLLPQFDASLGTLTGVTITNIGQMLGSIGVENTNNANQIRTIDTTLSTILQVILPTGATFTSNPLVSQTFTLARRDGTTDYGGTSGATASNLSAFNTAILNVNVADLALYQGVGTISFATSATGLLTLSDTFRMSSTYSDMAGILLGIQYDYTPIPNPEPSTFVLFGAGLAGAALLRRKMRKH